MSRCVVIADRSPEPSQEEIRSADLVIPLFLDSLPSLDSLGERVSFPTELIPASRARALADRALRDRDLFLERACAGETLDDLDVPAIFATDELLVVFREILFGQELGRILSERGIEKVSWVAATSTAGGTVAEDCRRALAASLGPEIELVETRGASARRREQPLLEKLSYPLRRLRNRLQSISGSDLGDGRWVAVFPGGHWQRFRSTLQDLAAYGSSPFQLWYLGRAGADLRKWSREVGIRLVNLPYPGSVDSDIEAFFDRHRNRWRGEGLEALAREIDCPVLQRPEVAARLDLYFDLTFRRTAQWARALRAAVQRAEPELVVGSAAFTYTTAMPFHVTKAAGVPSLALSHTQVSGDHSPVVSTYLACRNPFEREGFRRSFPDDSRALICENASDVLTYEVTTDAEVPAGRGERIVALLTAAPHFHLFAMPLHECGECFRTLRALSAPPDDLREFDLVWKSHPRFDLSTLLHDVDLAPNVRIYPASASVSKLIAESWICILVNHFGGVAVDVATAGKPLLFLDSAGYYYPRVEPSTLEAMERVGGVDELWAEVRALARDESRYRSLARKSRSFRDRRLAARHGSLPEALEEALGRRA